MRHQIWVVGGLSHLGDLMFWQKTLHKTWCISRSVLMRWRCHSPVAHSCSLLNHPNSFCGGMFKLNAKFLADALLYSMNLPHPLSSTAKSSLFTHAHSSVFSLAAILHQCHTKHSHYVNVSTISRETLYIFQKGKKTIECKRPPTALRYLWVFFYFNKLQSRRKWCCKNIHIL